MKIEGEAIRVTVYTGESDQWNGKALSTAIVECCRKEGLAGATVVRGIEGFGANSRVHTARLLDLSTDLPVLVIIVDKEERINRILPMLDEMVTEGLVTTERVHIRKYVHSRDKQDSRSYAA